MFMEGVREVGKVRIREDFLKKAALKLSFGR